MTARAHAVIGGRVQGVLFRAEARVRARSLGLGGWVRNLPDGSVEAVFEGERERIDLILRWCEQGPSGARVERVEVTWGQPAGDTEFEVR